MARRQHTTTAVDRARDLLRQVEDPLLAMTPRDVVSTDCVALELHEDALHVTLDVRTAAHPHARAIADACGRALERAGLSSETSVVLRADGFGARVGTPAPRFVRVITRWVVGGAGIRPRPSLLRS